MAARLVVREATLADAEPIALGLRTADFEEVFATVGPNVMGGLRSAITRSAGLCWTATCGERPVLLLGCAPLSMIAGEGSPWLLGTVEAARFPGALTKIAKRHIEIMRRTYPVLINRVDVRNEASVRWLARLGFTLEEPTPYGPFGLPFHRFTMGA